MVQILSWENNKWGQHWYISIYCEEQKEGSGEQMQESDEVWLDEALGTERPKAMEDCKLVGSLDC